MTDETADFEALDPERDVAVAALLADLPRLTMPPDVAHRIAAALAEQEPLSGPVPEWAAGGADNVTVLPSPQQRARRRGLTLLSGVAASVVVFVGLVVVGTQVFPDRDSGGGGTTAQGATAPGDTKAPEESTGASLLSTSGTQYTAADLDTQVTDLVAAASTPGAHLTTVSTDAEASLSPSPHSITTFSSSTALIADLLGVQVCLRKLDPGEVPIAADAGSWDGKQAVVIVYRGEQQARFDVYVVEPACGDAGDAEDHMLYYQAVPAP